jgi:ACS family hexuronate transporter-like MFS transporter
MTPVTLSRRHYLVLALLFASTVINYVDRQALSVLLPALRTDLHLSSADYGAITTAFMLAYTVSQLLSGALIDRVGTRTGFAIAMVIWSIAAMLHATATTAWSLLALRVLLGFGEAGNWPAGAKAVAEWFPQPRRAFAMGVFDGGSALGAIVAPPLVATLALTHGWRAAFLLTGVLGFAWLAAWLAIYRAPAGAPGTPPLGDPAARRGFWASVSEVSASRQLWGLMFTRMLATPVWWFYVFWLPDYLSKGRGFTLREIGLFGWIPYLTVDLGKLAGGAFSDRWLERGASATLARKSVMAAGALAMATGMFVVDASSAGAAIAWVSLATFGFGMWSANILALHADMFPADSMAGAVGMTGMAASLGGAAFTYAVGQMVDAAGYGPAFAMASLAPPLACIVLVYGIGRVTPLRGALAERS